MRTFVSGACTSENIFHLVNPAEFSEEEFEQHAIAALRCSFADYHCVPFHAPFIFEGVIHEADLALIHKKYSHWFIVEVEMTSHSLHGHVIPQVSCFRFGEPLPACADILCKGLPGLDSGTALSLLRYVPRSVAVLTNRANSEWSSVLAALSTQLVTVSVFSSEDGRVAHETEGSLHVAAENLGFWTYSAIDRSIKLPLSSDLKEGTVQIEDVYGLVGNWQVRRSSEGFWLTKLRGAPGIPDGILVQVIRSYLGKMKVRVPAAMG